MKELLGFLTVVDSPRLGSVGGFLVLNAVGQPIEFLCTAPIRASRTQEILYGSSLYPFLYGEQIGRTLVSKAKSAPGLVFTNVIPMLAAQDFIDIPVVFVPIPETRTKNDMPEHLADSLRSFGIKQEEPEPTPDGAADPISPNASSPMRCLHDIHGFSVDRWNDISCGRRLLSVPASEPDDLQTFRDRLAVLAKTLDFVEPFERIRLAIEETQKAA